MLPDFINIKCILSFVMRRHLKKWTDILNFLISFSFKIKQFFFLFPSYIISLRANEETIRKESDLNATPWSQLYARSKMIIYQWTLINRLLDDKTPHEIAYLWCRLSSLSTPADPSRSFIGGSFLPSFLRSLLRSFACSFSIFLHTSGRSRFLLGHVSILFLSQVCGPYPRKQRFREKARTASHSPIRETVVTRVREGQNIRRRDFVRFSL